MILAGARQVFSTIVHAEDPAASGRIRLAATWCPAGVSVP